MRWFDENERELPWRGSSPWGVLVSEFMLQQTPADRVIPVWIEWLDRWPTPQGLAASSVADALRAWGRLGYPRRAARLHEAAGIIVRDFDGEVPADTYSLRSLPGVGEYTAAAVQAFAFGRRSIVLDTNVRRVLARTLDGASQQANHITTAERTRSDLLWPASHARSARWSASVMEFGAIVCRARAPKCDECPVTAQCSWTREGRPVGAPVKRQPTYPGSDREARGRLMQVLREAGDHASAAAIATAWTDDVQRHRALDALVADGLAIKMTRGRYSLPGA
jgi:A/G-specific adenine glycosylase